jgi:hypothetical protein
MEKADLQEFLARGMSLAQIGRIVGLEESTVGYWVKKHGLAPVYREKHRARGAIPRDVLETLVERGRTIQEMADELERGTNSIRHWLKKYGLSTARARCNPPLSKDPNRPRYATRKCLKHGPAKFILENRGYYRCMTCHSERVASWRRRAKRKLAEEAGGRCALCGYDSYMGALQFHHLDRSTKSFQLSLRGITCSIEKLRAEAAKCVLLCANCHAEVEGGVTQTPSG